MDVQLAIIGAGPGGYVAAIRAAQRGADVCLIERDEVGGVCLNRGCIPTKALLASAELCNRIRRAAGYGLAVPEVHPDWAQIVRRKDEMVKRLVGGVQFLLKKNGVKLLKGAARFRAARELSVAGPGGETLLAAEKIIIATGTVPMIPPIFGHDGRQVITSDEALNLAELPRKLIIVGGGAIGCEFASIFHSFGVEVTVIELLPGLLPMFDAEIGRGLGLAFKKRGIGVAVGQKVEAVEKSEHGVSVRLAAGPDLTADKLLVSIGRRPVAAELGLEAAGVAVDERGRIRVGRDLETSTPGIYAIGDINDLPYDLAHAASHQGLAVVETLYGPGRTYEDNAVPNCVFTEPEIASVGLTAEEAGRKGLAVKTGKFPYSANGKALTLGEPDGWVKVVADGANGRIVGVHIMGAHASDLIAAGALAVSNGLTVEDLAATIHAHPTLPEMLMEAAEAVQGLSIHV